MNRTLCAIACVMGFLAVALGAFGSHSLKPLLTEHEQQLFETASRYHFYHALAMLAVSLLRGNLLIQLAGWLFAIGICLFCGSLYLLAVMRALHIPSWSVLGPITPVGGTLFLAAWTMLFAGIVSANNKSK